MSSAIPIQQLTRARVREVVAEAVSTPVPNVDAIADFVAEVDWSGWEAARAGVVELVGKLEGWTTEYTEGGITIAEYTSRLRETVSQPADHPNTRRMRATG